MNRAFLVPSLITVAVAGPGSRLQGFLLSNGTFVMPSPGLSQKLSSANPSNTLIGVAGDEFSYNGNRTVQAHRMSIAGNSYEDFPSAIQAPPLPVRTPSGVAAVPPATAPPPGPAAPPPPPPPAE